MTIFSTQFGVIFSHKVTREPETEIEQCVREVSQLQFSQPAWANTANQSALCQPFVLFLTITIYGTNWEGNVLATL